LPMRWQSRITQWEPNACFVDDQRSGPYRVWHHTHRFWAYQEGTVVEDSVRYALPAIPLISRLVQPLVDRDIAAIFAYRNRVLPMCLEQG
jgi:ligand-binding SRPBCC domain-containing protein